MIRIRPATVEDAPLLMEMIRELAEFERELDSVSNRAEDLARDGFGPQPRFRALIAEHSGEPAGYALFFGYYSTWGGRGLYLEDVFVRPAFRGRGVGKALFSAVARIALEDGCYGVHWEVLDWNQHAIEFYKGLGASFRKHMRAVFLTGPALQRLAEESE